MNLYIKSHFTEKIPTSKGLFIGLNKNQSIRNIEVGDYFYYIDGYNVLLCIDKEWKNFYFSKLFSDIVKYEIHFNIVKDNINIIESDESFHDFVCKEIKELKNVINDKY